MFHTMTPNEWLTIRHFSENEKWGNPEKMEYDLVKTLDDLRDFIGFPINIHCGYEDRKNNSQHCFGTAVDCHAKNLSLFEFYTAASRFEFNGIGIYPFWNNPGLHLDIRTSGHRAIWGKDIVGDYVPISSEFMRLVIDLPGIYEL